MEYTVSAECEMISERCKPVNATDICERGQDETNTQQKLKRTKKNNYEK